MNSSSQSEALHLSFSELVWFALLIVIMIFAYCQNEARNNQKELQAAVSAHVDHVAKLEDENRALRAEKAKLEQIAQDKAELERALNDEKAKNQKLHAECKALGEEKKGLSARIQELERETQSLLARSKELELQLAAVNRDMNAVEEALAREKKQHNSAITECEARYSRISREMIDIRGKLDDVVCIVDCSSSMLAEKKWEATKKIIGTWISYLPIRRLMLITYNEDVNSYPDGYINLGGDHARGADDPNLSGCIQYLKEVKPQGFSDTYAALKKAYGYRPDTIILFTDGSPNRTDKTSRKNLDETEMKKIEELVAKEENRKVPINIIGFGDYFDPSIGNHIRRVTDLTDGTFIGR